MFQPLNFRLKKYQNLEQHIGDLIISYAYIKYYKLNQAYKILPSQLLALNPDRISWTVVTSRAGAPHKDHRVVTNLNIYVDPGGAVTKFYETKPGAQPWSPDPSYVPNLYHKEDLVYHSEFKAEPFDPYLLDVSQVHEVVRTTVTDRTMIQLSWMRKKYYEVLREYINLMT